MEKIFLLPNQLTIKTAGNRIKTARKEMKKVLLVLVALMSFNVAAIAQKQSRIIDLPKGGTIEVTAHRSYEGQPVCRAYCNSSNKPQSGVLYATIYYVDKDGDNTSLVITMSFDNICRDSWGNENALIHDGRDAWYGQAYVKKITDFKVEKGVINYR